MRREDDLSQPMTIERRLECGDSLRKEPRKLAASRDDALIAGRETLDQGKIRFGQTQHIANADGVGRLTEREAAGTAAHGLEVTCTSPTLLRCVLDILGPARSFAEP